MLEDLHWGDFDTVRFLDAALRDRRDRPWMVLALSRPEVFEMFPQLWAERQNVQDIHPQLWAERQNVQGIHPTTDRDRSGS